MRNFNPAIQHEISELTHGYATDAEGERQRDRELGHHAREVRNWGNHCRGEEFIPSVTWEVRNRGYLCRGISAHRVSPEAVPPRQGHRHIYPVLYMTEVVTDSRSRADIKKWPVFKKI